MKKNLLMIIIVSVVIGVSLFAGGVTEDTTYAKTILERKDSVSAYFQQVVQPFTLKNGPLQLTAVPLLSETYVLSEYPDMKNKRYNTTQMTDKLGVRTKALDRQQEMSGTFLVFLRYERSEEVLGLSSFTIDPSFFEYMFLDNDKGDFLRVGNHSVVRAKTVDAYNKVLEFWVTFGENDEERKKFFQDSKTVSISVTDFGFEGQVISYELPISGMYSDIPKEPKEILTSMRSSLKVAFEGAATPGLTGQVLGSLISEPEKPSRKGYTFGGWYKDAQSSRAWDFKKDAILDDTTLYAKWNGNSYTVNFNSQGGSNPNPASKSVTNDQTYGALPSVSRTGYSFAGWWTGPGGSGAQIQSATTVSVTSNQTLYAKWNGNSYTVNFNSQGGSNPNPASKSVTNNQTYGALPNVSRTGYSFAGWWTGPRGSGAQILATTVLSMTGNQTLYAHWKDIEVGDIGPSGGYVFYENPNSATDGWRYLEAAPAGWSGESGDPWYMFGYHRPEEPPILVGTEVGIGSGKENTQKLVGAMGSDAYSDSRSSKKIADYAAKVCADYRGGGHDDWFLPSKDELNLMYRNLKEQNLGGFPGGDYWSSSECKSELAWLQNFSNGYPNDYPRNSGSRVRPVRAF